MQPISQRTKPRVYTKVVSRSAADKPDYICDGVADDVQIQAAINAVGAAGGGVVLLKAGTYVIATDITDSTYSDVHLMGEGIGATILQAKAAYTGFAVIYFNQSHATISNLTVDGNKANQTTENHTGIGLNVDYNENIVGMTVKDVEVKNMNRDGNHGRGIYAGFGTLFKIINCYTHDCELTGIYLEDVEYTTVENTISSSNAFDGFDVAGGTKNKFVNCIAKSNTRHGFINNNSQYHAYLNCTAVLNTQNGFDLGEGLSTVVGCISIENTGKGVFIQGSNTIITGCKIALNTDVGLDITTSFCVVTGNNFYNSKKTPIRINGGGNNTITGNTISSQSGLDADNTYSGILLTGTALRNIITGNRIDGDGLTNDLAYGIREAAAADNRNLITSNIVTGADTAQISTQGANSVSADNITA